MQKLERVTHLCLIAVCVVSSGVLLERSFSPKSRSARPIDGQALVGKILEAPGLDLRSARMNAVLFLNTHCHFCQESMPFYRHLGEMQGGPTGMRFSVLSAEAPGTVRDHLFKEHVTIGGVYQVSLSDSVLRATPTLLIVDAGGIIRKVFVGKLSPSQEKEFLKLIATDAV